MLAMRRATYNHYNDVSSVNVPMGIDVILLLSKNLKEKKTIVLLQATTDMKNPGWQSRHATHNDCNDVSPVLTKKKNKFTSAGNS